VTRARVAWAAVAAAFALAAAPGATARAAPPTLDGAAAAILVDARDGTPLLAKAPGRRRAMASATKLMTALLTLERADMDAVFTAADYDAAPIESQIGLQPGERMRVRDLFEALMLESANDAAVTLAEGISGSRAAFVGDMNARAAELGLAGTGYANPIGLDAPGNHSTAADLAALARILLDDPRFARLVDMPAATLESGARERVVANRNELIATHPFVDGVKTGYTSNAGYVLVGSATGRSGAQVVSVVLGEPSEAARNEETLALLRYGVRQFRLAPVLRRGRAVETVDVAYRDEQVRLVPARGARVLVRRGQALRTRVAAPDELHGDLAAGSRVGRVAVVRDGEVIRRVALVTASAVPGAGLPRKVAATLGISVPLLLALAIMVSLIAIMGIRAGRTHRARGRRDRSRARERTLRQELEEPVERP
jgi:D-alanyl-D-alanine carboxypeptidase (penicillin-binding protein 5/6)